MMIILKIISDDNKIIPNYKQKDVTEGISMLIILCIIEQTTKPVSFSALIIRD